MLEFAVTYRVVVDSLTSERGLGLRDYEMDEAEWTIAKQLRDVLQVSVSINQSDSSLTTLTT